MPSASVPPPAIDALPAEDSRDPDVWVVAVAWATIAFSALQILLFSFGRDQSIYAMVASNLLDGGLPYRDAWDFKPPGIFLLYAASFALFGESMLAPRVLEVLGLLGLVFACQRLGQTFFGSRTTGLVGGAVAALTHAELEFWHTGQPETFGSYFIFAALVLTSHEYARRRNRTLAWVAIGIAFGCAFLLKPPLGGGAPVCAAYAMRQIATERTSRLALLTPVLVIGAASLLPIALCALWFWASGGLGELHWTLVEFTPGYTTLGWRGQSAATMFYFATEQAFFDFSAMIGVGFIAAIAMRPLHAREREGMFLLCGVASVQLAGVAMQGKFFEYHFAATLPLLALLSGLGWYKLWRRVLMQGSGAWLAFAAFVLVVASMRRAVYDVPHGFWKRSLIRLEYLVGLGPPRSRAALDQELYRAADYDLAANRRVAHEVVERTAATDVIYVWGFEPGIYWLSGREPASRFIYNVPQRATWQREQARAALERDLREARPAMILVQRNDVFPMVTGDDLDSAHALHDFEFLNRLLSEHYELSTSIDDFQLYRREPRAPESAAKAR